MSKVMMENLTKRFAEVTAVNNVNLDIEDREFVVLVGPSGCGKTTTLRMVAGLEEITEGSIFIGDRLVNDVPPKDRNIAMVFQNYALYPHMNVFNNMAFGLKLRKIPKDEIEERVKRAAQILGIEELLDRKPRQLSGGQRQRVAVGRAIVRDPEVFLFDEPLSNLDAKLRVAMRAELIKLHRSLDATMIYVTHDQVEAMTMANRIVIMKDGLIQQEGSPLDVYDHPVNVFVAGFIGSPAMNFARGEIVSEGDVFYCQLGGQKLKLTDSMKPALSAYNGKEVVFGIRPESITDDENEAAVGEWARLDDMHVEVYEPLGSDVILELSHNGTSFTAKVDPHTHSRMGVDVPIWVDMSVCKLFDAQTEEVIA